MNSTKKNAVKNNKLVKQTLDIHHSKYLDDVSTIKNEIEFIEKEISTLSTKIEELQQKKKVNNASDEEITILINCIDRKIEYQRKLDLNKKIFNQDQYYTCTADILFKYYDIIEKGDTKSGSIKLPVNGTSILSYFNTKKDTEYIVPVDAEKNKGELLNKYMTQINADYIEEFDKRVEECSHCGCTDMVVMNNDGYMFCKSCHNMEYIIIDHEKPSYRDPPKEITCFTYKRINHLQIIIILWNETAGSKCVTC